MKRILTPLLFLVLLAAACGDSTSEVGTGSSSEDPAVSDGSSGETDPDAPIPVEPDGGIGDGAEPLSDAPSSIENEQVITDDKPVDGKVTTPYEVVINPDNDSELWVRFVGGDSNCTAAFVTVLTETPDAVSVELTVGITDDALVKSCLAGEFNLRVDVPLNEPATAKSISWSSATAGDEPQLVTPDLSTDDFIGLTEAEASAIAEENIIDWRVVRVDSEWFAVTEDYRPDRLNFEIDNGIITVVTLG